MLSYGMHVDEPEHKKMKKQQIENLLKMKEKKINRSKNNNIQQRQKNIERKINQEKK